ncbi:MAG: hypothetical protein ACRCVB_01320 [Cetobacterium sp.]
MSTTAITLLKILLHGDMHIDEIGKYINLDTNTIERNMQTLNEYLKANDMNVVKKINNIYSLENKNDGFADFFSKLDVLTSDERIDIYCIRFLLKGYINLEKERQQMGVSRTTAIKDFKRVRELLETNKIFIESRNSKGIFLKESNNTRITEILCDKLMRLFAERDFLSKKRRELLEEINILDEKSFVKIYKEITDVFKIKKSIFTFYAIYSMALIEKHKGVLCYDSPNIDTKEKTEEIMERLNNLKNSVNMSENLKNAIGSVLLKGKYYISSDYPIEKHFSRFSNRLQEVFGMNNDETKRLENYILSYFAIGYLDKKYGVLWVRKNPYSVKCRKLGEIIENILNELNLEMMYSDILRLAGAISRFFMEEEYIEGFKILSVSRNLDEEYNERVVACMKELYPDIEFYYQSFLEFRFNTEDEIKEFDLIISDTESYSIKNLRKVNALSVREIQRCFIEFVLDKRFKKAGLL